MASTRPRLLLRGLSIGGVGPLDAAIAPGECLALSGPSGAGKTRLLRAIADLDPHGGECRLDDRPAGVFAAPAWRRAVAYLPAEPAWWADTPRDHLRTADAPAGHDRLAALDLETTMLDRPLTQLSSGQRQRLALLRLLDGQPQVLLLDEPTANLDADNIARVEALVADYCAERDAACVWVSHDPGQRRRVAHRQLALDGRGRVTACS